MSNSLILDKVWNKLSKAVKKSSSPSMVAVAYWGNGASKLLPLKRGSTLVVDASLKAVSSGQTCPEDLKKMQKRGVKLYSCANLHAKVYVISKRAYIGSANVSKHSSEVLSEAMLSTADDKIVKEAREFIKKQCVQELGPELLDQLVHEYNPPIGGGGGSKSKHTRIEYLERTKYTEEEKFVYERGKEKARKRWKKRKGWIIDDYHLDNRLKDLSIGTKVYQIVEEDDGKILMSPPGNVIHLEHSNGNDVFVYLEIPTNKHRKQLSRVKYLVGAKLKSNLNKSHWTSKKLEKALHYVWNGSK